MSVKMQFDASLDAVFEYLADPDFLVERAMGVGDVEASYEVEEDDETVTVIAERITRTELPGFLAKLFKPEQEITITETWTGDSDLMKGDYEMVIHGQPARVSASITLKADGDEACSYSITHKAKVDIPLIGAKAAKFLLGETERVAALELEYLAEQL
ncbi:MAG: DUF2505 domain-containing protein [Pseudomonadota bacterium]